MAPHIDAPLLDDLTFAKDVIRANEMLLKRPEIEAVDVLKLPIVSTRPAEMLWWSQPALPAIVTNERRYVDGCCY